MPALDQVEKLRSEAIERIGSADSLDSLNALQVQYLGRKGELTAILKSLKELPIEERKEVGAAVVRLIRGE